MCTLIIGRGVIGPNTIVLAANRDEDSARPSDPPMVLCEDPWVVGGRDRVAGGTWLAIRDGLAVVALLNRHDPNVPTPRSAVRSRGLLTLDVAGAAMTAEDLGGPEDRHVGFTRTALRQARAALESDRYAPFTLVVASTPLLDCLVMTHDGQRAPQTVEVRPGWSVLTHRDLNDPNEPRTSYLLGRLRGFEPTSLSQAVERLGALLRWHGEDGTPPVCIHQGRMVTVSSSIVAFEDGKSTYLHADGRPCEHAYQDVSGLLTPAARKGNRS